MNRKRRRQLSLFVPLLASTALLSATLQDGLDHRVVRALRHIAESGRASPYLAELSLSDELTAATFDALRQRLRMKADIHDVATVLRRAHLTAASVESMCELFRASELSPKGVVDSLHVTVAHVDVAQEAVEAYTKWVLREHVRGHRDAMRQLSFASRDILSRDLGIGLEGVVEGVVTFDRIRGCRSTTERASAEALVRRFVRHSDKPSIEALRALIQLLADDGTKDPRTAELCIHAALLRADELGEQDLVRIWRLAKRFEGTLCYRKRIAHLCAQIHSSSMLAIVCDAMECGDPDVSTHAMRDLPSMGSKGDVLSAAGDRLRAKLWSANERVRKAAMEVLARLRA
ncbi:MAG: hypothetical protein KDC95_11460 [Planctomycetes bacterium]|nr:hypothetical protein [Planctomycetota bacterium]